MSAEVVAWLESPEGDKWHHGHFQRVFASVLYDRAERSGDVPLAAILPAPGMHVLDAAAEMGPLDPQHDPCGRPPVRA